MKYISLKNILAAGIIGASIAIAPFAFAATTTNHGPNTTHPVHHAQAPRKGLGGTVTAISGTTITVSSGKKNPITYTINASGAHFLGKGITTIANVHVGDQVVAIGAITGTNVQAKIIVDRPASEGTPKAFTFPSPKKSGHH